jgi:glycosyl hydrolase family 106( putative alpha-L-rhamnosidase)/glycosyl hydrolase family 2
MVRRTAMVLFLCAPTLVPVPIARAESSAQDPIAAGFRVVPPEARLRMFWRIFGPAWTREEIDSQLEQLQRAGVGGVMTCFTYPIALDDPAKGIKNELFLSPEFLDNLRHATEKARQLGLDFGVCGGTGWPFGGPSVTERDAAQRLREETVTPFADGKGYALPALRAGERYLAAFSGTRDVTAFIRGDRLEAPVTGRPLPVVFIAGPTYMKVKRPSLGGEGYVVDHFRKQAVRRYLDGVVAPMLQAAPDGLIHTLFCDSLEVYHANWTHDFARQFQRRRGYDLIPHLPDLFDEASPAAQDLKFDFWRTAAELAEQEFARTVHTWCRRRGVSFALEPYGTPSMGFTGARFCDVPWGEQYEWKGFSFSRFTASAGHLAGKKIIGAEAWTWAGIPNRLADSLSDLKLCSDLHFLSGENELTGVDFPYSPRAEGAPGWLPYFGPVMNQNNPQWLCFPDLARYASRCQWLLRQGKPIADVALYTPTEDAFANGSTDQMLLDFQLRDRLVTGEPTDEFGLDKALRHQSDVIYSLLMNGFNFDGIDCFAVNELARVKGNRLAAGDGRYAIVVLPNLTGMDLDALEKIAGFCRAGGTVIATRRLPSRVYGWHQEEATQRLRARLAEMFGPDTGKSASVHPYGKGQAIFTPDEREGLASALAQAGIGPDMRVSPFRPGHPRSGWISHVHRRAGDRDFYFVANVGATEARFTADFRVGGRSASLWDPMSGEITPLPILAQDRSRTQVALALPPRGSVFVCFAGGGQPPASSRGVAPTFRSEGLRAEARSYGSPEGLRAEARSYGSPEGLRAEARSDGSQSVSHLLKLAWRVTFDGPDAPPPHETRDLTSWTGWPGGRFFSGRATYTGTFESPVSPSERSWLRFEAVREVAQVVVNGHPAGAIWTPPYELEVTSLLKPGPNTLQITVANLPVNRFLGLPDPDLGPLAAAYGERFPAPQEKQLMPEPAPSGLIGKVLLISGGWVP